MGWVDSPKFFCAFLETLTDVANPLVDTNLPVPSYSMIYESQQPIRAPLTTLRASPIYIAIWMTSSQRCKGSQITNTEFLMAQYMPSSGSSSHYRGS